MKFIMREQEYKPENNSGSYKNNPLVTVSMAPTNCACPWTCPSSKIACRQSAACCKHCPVGRHERFVMAGSSQPARTACGTLNSLSSTSLTPWSMADAVLASRGELQELVVRTLIGISARKISDSCLWPVNGTHTNDRFTPSNTTFQLMHGAHRVEHVAGRG